MTLLETKKWDKIITVFTILYRQQNHYEYIMNIQYILHSHITTVDFFTLHLLFFFRLWRLFVLDQIPPSLPSVWCLTLSPTLACLLLLSHPRPLYPPHTLLSRSALPVLAPASPLLPSPNSLPRMAPPGWKCLGWVRIQSGRTHRKALRTSKQNKPSWWEQLQYDL